MEKKMKTTIGIDNTSILIEFRDEIKGLKNSLYASNKKIDDLTEVKNSQKAIGKVAEEVIAVKLENRMLRKSVSFPTNKKFEALPYVSKEELLNLNEELQKDEEILHQFVGGDGRSQFLRAAVRKVFTDELASMFSWKGAAAKPSAEKLFIVTIIKNICHLKFHAEDKDINGVLQKHFVHAKERAVKPKR